MAVSKARVKETRELAILQLLERARERIHAEMHKGDTAVGDFHDAIKCIEDAHHFVQEAFNNE